jgi:hypothetical protein
MDLRLSNLSAWSDSVNNKIKLYEKKVVDARREVARVLTESLVANIPVWSGRTVRSVQASNSVAPAPMENHPDRGNTSDEGFFRYHQEFGGTSRLPMGSEPMRSSAEAQAYASLGSVSYDIDKPLFITISSTAASKMNVGAAPSPEAARNRAVVTEIAKAQVKAMFPFVKGG